MPTDHTKTAKKGKRDRLPLHLIGGEGVEVADTVKDLKPYEAVSSFDRILERPEMEHFKLDWNEATIPPSPSVRKALMRYLDGPTGLNIYPQLFSRDLRLKLQSHVGCPADHILVSNGSDDALDLICKTYLNPGDRVVSPYPTYTHFLLYARSRGAVIDRIVSDDPFENDLRPVFDAVTDETKLIYLVNPNNPTGQFFEAAELAGLAEAAPRALVIIDEAYAEFARSSAVELVGRYANVAITRSFSKAFGLAGLRIGYLVAQPDIIRKLCRLYNPKSVNQLAQVAASAVLDDLEYYDRYIDEVKRSKRLLGRWCRRRGLTFHNTPANFVMIKVERLKEVIEGLADKGVYVRDRSGFPHLEGYFRLNPGTVEQTVKVIRRFEQVLKDLDLI